MRTPQQIAATWRRKQPANRRTTGIALVYGGRVYAWKNELRDPQHEQPGAVAVDVSGNTWTATGGNSRDGAKSWDPMQA